MNFAESNADSCVEEITSETFWRQRFPSLSIGERLSKGTVAQIQPDVPATRRWFERMREEGYLQDTADTLRQLAPKLAAAVETCKALDIPPAFIFLFDESWECFYALHPLLRFFLGDTYRVLPDFWAWHVDPRNAEMGWRPHRDKGRISLKPDGMPASLTVWIPLTESVPQNGCIYILPANRDPVYGTENEANWQIDMARIRALPAKPGDFLCWSQAVVHWGGESSRFGDQPRISMALEFQSGERPPFNHPLLPPFGNLKFAARVLLVSKQILQYKHMYPLASRFELLAKRLLGV